MVEFKASPIVLQNEWVRLEPFTEDHFERLFKIATPETFRYFIADFSEWSLTKFKDYFRPRLDPSNQAMVAVRPSDDQVMGFSTMFDFNPNRWLEIGYTWYGEAFRRGPVNPSCKLLMIGHAIETLGAVRVQLKCDARNEASRGAMTKLGLVYEGTLRGNFLLADGTPRNTAYFSVLPSEWPALKQKLLERLAAFSS